LRARHQAEAEAKRNSLLDAHKNLLQEVDQNRVLQRQLEHRVSNAKRALEMAEMSGVSAFEMPWEELQAAYRDLAEAIDAGIALRSQLDAIESRLRENLGP
jgi:hypothetical protein